jgi:hypothetical protein
MLLHKLINFLLLPFAFFVIVIPNSFQVFTISIFSLLFLLVFISVKRVYDISLMINWAIISALFGIFILASPIDNTNKLELVFKYIVSPFFWITLFCYIKQVFTREFIIKRLIFLSFIANISVPLLYIIMSMGYIDVIEYFVSIPNIDQITGLGFTLHVYGCIIFFALAIGPSFFYINNIFYEIIYTFSFIIAGVLSGRTALIFIILIGLILSIFYLKKIKINLRKVAIGGILVVLLGQLAFSQYAKYFDVNIIDYFETSHLRKIQDAGGEERTIQTTQILHQFYKNPLGSGFVTLDIIRDQVKTYNYEVLILTIPMRFGIITFLIISYSIFRVFGYLFYNDLVINKKSRDFLVLGFIAILLSSFTNPYLESFCFQWMFFGPLILLKRNFAVRD